MYASLTVVRHAPHRAVGAVRHAREAAARVAERPGVAFARPIVQTARFRADARPPFIPGRVAVMAWAEDPNVLDLVRSDLAGRFTDAAVERWHVVVQPVRIHGEWLGFSPDVSTAEPLAPSEPVVVMIHGVLKGRYLRKFMVDNVKVGKQLAQTPGYLGGLGMGDTAMTTTSFSCWRTAREAQQFAFASGAHRQAYKIDLAEERHASQFFVRFRPISSEGTLDGRDPLAAVLTPA